MVTYKLKYKNEIFKAQLFMMKVEDEWLAITDPVYTLMLAKSYYEDPEKLENFGAFEKLILKFGE